MALIYPREMFEQMVQKFRESGRTIEPTALQTLYALVDTVFFASLMREEGESVRVAIVHYENGSAGLAQVTDTNVGAWGEEGPPLAWDVAQLDRCSFDATTLAKLSVGLRYGTHLVVVVGRAPELWIDGIARRTPRTDGGEVTRIAAPRPGVIVWEEGDRELLRYEAGERPPRTMDVLFEPGPVLGALAAIIGHDINGKPGYVVQRLLREMRAKEHGAILAMLPQAPDEKILRGVSYHRADPQILASRLQVQHRAVLTWVAQHMSATDVCGPEASRTEKENASVRVETAIQDIANLSAIDGSILAGPGLAIYGAGYLIPTSSSQMQIVRALNLAATKTERWKRRYGARHKAAFSFAHDHPNGVAFVVSEDGPIHCAMKIGRKVVVWPVHVSET